MFLLGLKTTAVVGVAAAVAEASQGADPSSLLPIGGYLTPAVVLVMIIRGDLASGRENKRLVQENEAKDAIIKEERGKNEKLSASAIDRLVPALTEATSVIREQTLREIRRERRT